jgi:hypothetical protein
MKHLPRIRTVLGILALIAIAFLAWIALLPRHRRPTVSINLLGYTNDSSGTRLAMIGVTNLSPFKIYVYLPTIEISAPTAPGGLAFYHEGNTNQWQRFHSELGEGMAEHFTIPSPTIQSPWRISFYVYTDLGTVQVIKRFMSGGRYMPFAIESDWIASEK